MENEKNVWQISQENEKKLTLEEAKFIFSQAEKQLRESINNSNSIVTRTTILFTVIVGLLSALIGYTINKMDTGMDYKLCIISLVSSLYLFCVAYYVIKNIKGQDYMSMGSEPNMLFHDYYFQTYPNKEEREVQNYISEIKNYQERIVNNKKVNNSRWNRFHNSINYLFCFPVIAVGLYFIIIYLF
jgi:hypothetical protein